VGERDCTTFSFFLVLFFTWHASLWRSGLSTNLTLPIKTPFFFSTVNPWPWVFVRWQKVLFSYDLKLPYVLSCIYSLRLDSDGMVVGDDFLFHTIFSCQVKVATNLFVEYMYIDWSLVCIDLWSVVRDVYIFVYHRRTDLRRSSLERHLINFICV